MYFFLTIAALFSNPSIGGLGGVFCDSKGNWVMDFTAYTTAQDINQLEILALLAGLHLTVTHNLKPLKINMDVEQVVTMLTDPNSFTESSTLFSNCRYLLLHLDGPVLTYIYRDQNRLADSLARKSSSTVQYPVYLSVF